MVHVEQQHKITQRLLFAERYRATNEYISRYLGPPRFPGTTSIGHRLTHPEIFQDTLGCEIESYQQWVLRSVEATVSAVLASTEGFPADRNLENQNGKRIVEQVLQILDFETHDGKVFADAIPQQMYEDVFLRIINYVLHPGGGGKAPHLYRNFNALSHRLGLTLIRALSEGTQLDDIDRLIRVSVLAGHIGINLKSSASAASLLLNRDILPLNADWIATSSAVKRVSASDQSRVIARLLEIVDGPDGSFGLSSINDYFREVVDASEPTLIAFFADDYLESILDLKRCEVLLSRNPNLIILFIPRAGRFGNDLSYRDAEEILMSPEFDLLRYIRRTGRFHLSAHGPLAGCVDPRDVSRNLICELDTLGGDCKVIFETKGCRNFEMLRGGLPFPWYCSFNCNRALSIRTVQVDGPPVFLRIPPWLDAYARFAVPKIGRSPSYPNQAVRFAGMTTRDLFSALRTPLYRSWLARCSDEARLNALLAKQCQANQLTVVELIERSEDLRCVVRRTIGG
jgi:hypothetical protein